MVDDFGTVPRYRHNSDKVDERFTIPSIIEKRGLTFLSSLERSLEEIDSLIIRVFTFGAFGHFSIGTLKKTTITTEKLGKLVTSQPGEIRTSVDNGRVISPYILEIPSASCNYLMTQKLTTTTKLQLRSTGPITMLGFFLAATLPNIPSISKPVVEYKPGPSCRACWAGGGSGCCKGLDHPLNVHTEPWMTMQSSSHDDVGLEVLIQRRH